MSIIYDGSHRIIFIDSSQQLSSNDSLTEYNSFYDTWVDFHLVPSSRPFIEIPEALVLLANDTVSNRVFDITDRVAGGQIFGPRQGQWEFIVDHDRWTNWYTAKKTIEDRINGKRLYCCLMDDYSTLYSGRFVVAGWKDGASYSTVTIQYYLDYETYSLELDLNEPTSLSVSLDPNAPTFYTEDYINRIKPYVNAVVTYGSGKQKSVVIDDLTGIFQNVGTQNVTVSYTEKGWASKENLTVSSSVEINVVQVDHWAKIRESILRGTYRNDYPIGKRIPLSFGEEYSDYVRVVGIDADVDPDGNRIPLTFLSCNVLKTPRVYNSEDTSFGGYPASGLRSYVSPIYNDFPASLKSIIVQARKTSYDVYGGQSRDLKSDDLVWIPSYREVFCDSNYEISGVEYADFYLNNSSRIAYDANGNAKVYWLRSAAPGYDSFATVSTDGSLSAENAIDMSYIVIGFCVGVPSDG